MTLMDAQQYDGARARRRRFAISGMIVAVLVLVWLGYHLRNHSERRVVNRFFAALQKQDYEEAYGLWWNDPQWKQHPQNFPNYQYNDFYRDWGPGGEWGLIKRYSVDCSFATDSGVVVQVTVNGRADHAYSYVLKSNKSLSFSPTEIQCGNWLDWLTE